MDEALECAKNLLPDFAQVYSTRYAFLFCFFVTLLLVSIPLVLPMFHLTFSAAVIDSVASVAWSEFVF